MKTFKKIIRRENGGFVLRSFIARDLLYEKSN